LLAPPKKKD